MYDMWKAKDGRNIPVTSLTALHLLHIIRGIEEGRLFADDTDLLTWCRDAEADMPSVLQAAGIADRRDRWLIVLRAEAIRRGLDYTKAPSRKVGLIEWLYQDAVENPDPYYDGKCHRAWLASLRQQFQSLMQKAGIEEPQIDVSNLDDQPSFMHWAAGGTPIVRAK